MKLDSSREEWKGTYKIITVLQGKTKEKQKQNSFLITTKWKKRENKMLWPENRS